ncbi:DUF1176 domain-containing protein [Cohaesibacter intestini]|uniref:DUF1176 domain-containing protein n=1 Tax=Cohaesibacter intestini TaxID=2211145 RepID=UPI0013001C74|nr:DUF1176 domain-containing protein [Cohaesibacter intestini]
MIRQSLTFLTMLLPILGASGPTQAASYKEIRDVTVWCDVAMSCSLTLSADKYQGVTALVLHRANRLNDAASVRFTSAVPIVEGAMLLLTIDGKDSLTLIANKTGIKEDGNSYHETNPHLIDWIIKGMKAGSTLSIAIDSAGQSSETGFSLSGSVAGMIFMDEYQDLLETSYAFHVTGTKRPHPRLPIVGVEQRSQVPRAIWNGWFAKEQASCHFYRESIQLPGNGFRLTLRSGDVYGLPCGDGGAYNQPFAAFFVPKNENLPIKAVPFLLDGNNTDSGAGPDLWNIGYDARKGVLTSYFKARGLGDCGVQTKWQLNEVGDAVFFEAMEIREKGDCDGNYAGGPDKWPKTWPVED